MPIQIQCTNILRFNKKTGGYEYCNHVFQVGDDQMGFPVECPACGGSVEAVSNASDPSTEEIDPQLADVPVETTQTRWTVEPPPPEKKNIKYSEAEIPCINCHSRIPTDAKECPSCGYVQPVAKLEPESTGFAYWLQQQLAEGTNITGVTIWAVVLCGLLAILCVGSGLMVLAPSMSFLLGPLLVFVILLAVLVLAGRKPDESLFAAARRIASPWTGLLMLARAWYWRELKFPFRSRRILDLRDQDLVDDDLADIDDLDQIQVLDLEGTRISDDGLQYLYGLPKLSFLVVRRSKVSREAVRKLQNARPNLWIWS